MGIKRSRIDAVNLIAATVPRVQQEIWLVKNETINPALAIDGKASTGERLIASLCVSIWDGSMKVSLVDLIELDDMRFQVALHALALARGEL